MFSSSFLSGVSSAVSSASIPKFSLFGDDADESTKQEAKPSGSQQSPAKGQGPPPQKQGASLQSSGGKNVHPEIGPQKQGPKSGPQQQNSGKTDQGSIDKSAGPQLGFPKAVPQPAGTGKPEGPLCLICKATELNLQAKDQPPNYNTCTQCKQQVCSLCGFSPPDSVVSSRLNTYS